ncbi:trehalose-phosphatase [uncultured Microbacterium sp.]|uniref:trehalose-phosphatase n=1 Tax=uncultured Microbacterium sp. TaxID=191216 RepID=UPI0026133359|nr:trehalose-phosphatase [uncultured Microbacterium sp.]
MTPDDAVSALAAVPRLLIALDFDGTLAPLQDEPMASRMTPLAAAAVAALARAPETTVAFVSGRSLRDLRVIAEHDDDSPILLAGSHGAEQWPTDAEATADGEAEALRDELSARAEEAAGTHDGAWIERKGFGFALHTRLAPPDAARAAGQEVDAIMTERAPAWRRRTGHDILEFSFRDEGKDVAVARLRALTQASAVLFAGDDVTDEDALRSLGAGDVGVRVGPGETAAAVRVGDITELAEMLVHLARERTLARQ